MKLLIGNNLGVLVLIVVWVLPWKVYSVWVAAKRGDKKWFAALLILNTFAILDIFYIFYITKKTWKEVFGSFRRVFRFVEKKLE